MENYTFQKEIGSGSFAVVSKALHKKTGEIVAIKKMNRKFNSWEECLALREVKSLMKIRHPNIIAMKEAFRCNSELFLVFEYINRNVYQLYLGYKNKGEHMPEREIKGIVEQVAVGLSFMHKHGFFHRDLKPENICITQDNIVKLIDFGLAREIRSAPPFTDYVATRWYRAPEIIMKAPNYNSPVDIFALGCIMAELYLMSPIFCGNSEIDQLHKIFSIIGTPTPVQWQQGYKLASQVGISFPQYEGIELKEYLQNASDEAVNVIKTMLQVDPSKRPTASQLLTLPFFNSERGQSTKFEHSSHHISKSTSPYKHEKEETSKMEFKLPNSNNRNLTNVISNSKEEAKYNFSIPNSFKDSESEKSKPDAHDLFSYKPSINAGGNLKMANQEAFKYNAMNEKKSDSRFTSGISNLLGNQEEDFKSYGRHNFY